MVHHVKVETWR